jgi:hypothetical protein
VVADQVHRWFGSTVHFSPSPLAKEFFLVVSFSSAFFKISEESVGLALQSCIGGLAKGFRVFQLSDQRFRFSVSSNKVGHFIYGLKDRLWPDFVCHFSLYRGYLNHIVTPFEESTWNSSDHLVDVAHRSSKKFSSSIQVLKDSADCDPISSSAELAKFGLDQSVLHSTCKVGLRP